ncbi:DNA ligase 1-like protein [Drosera capensis]
MLRPSPLTVAQAFDTFLMIAKDSQERKKNYIKKLLVAAKDCEPVYLIRLLQIHYMEDVSVEIYSRNAERNTGKSPDVVVAVLSTRARKNVTLSDIKVDVCIYAFDILYLNGKPLLHEQLSVRRELLCESFEEEPGYFHFATAVTNSDLEEIQKFLDAAVNASVKRLEPLIKSVYRHDLQILFCISPSKTWLMVAWNWMMSIEGSLMHMKFTWGWNEFTRQNHLKMGDICRIPPKFAKKYGKDLLKTACLTVPNGAVWKVEVVKSGDVILLSSGWDKFMENFSIKLGHFLVFRYEGNSCFYVLIFDMSATEIKYPTLVRKVDYETDCNAGATKEVGVRMKMLDESPSKKISGVKFLVPKSEEAETDDGNAQIIDHHAQGRGRKH